MPTADYSSYHQSSGTGADGTKFSNFIDAVQATVNALDKNNLAAAAGILASQLADPTAGKVLGSAASACAAVFPPGYEIHYKEFIAAVTISATSEGSPTNVVVADAITFDGTACWFEFWCPYIAGTSSTNSLLSGALYDGTTSQGKMFFVENGASPGQVEVPGHIRRKLTPSAGSHTFKIAAWMDAGSGTVGAGAGGAGNFLPGYIRITKA